MAKNLNSTMNYSITLRMSLIERAYNFKLSLKLNPTTFLKNYYMRPALQQHHTIFNNTMNMKDLINIISDNYGKKLEDNNQNYNHNELENNKKNHDENNGQIKNNLSENTPSSSDFLNKLKIKFSVIEGERANLKKNQPFVVDCLASGN
jgi:hypothetical protein